MTFSVPPVRPVHSVQESVRGGIWSLRWCAIQFASGGLRISNHPEDMELLERISGVSAAAHAPFLTAASPELRTWTALQILSHQPCGPGVRDRRLRQVEVVPRVRGFALCSAVPAAHIDALTLWRDTKTVAEFNDEEEVDGKKHDKYLWGNAAYALGSRLTEAFAKSGWCAAIRGDESGGKVEGLPAHAFRTDEGEVALKCPTEIAISDRREQELADQGFVSLVAPQDTPITLSSSAFSRLRSRRSTPAAANANAKLSAQLPYILAMSRFAHYMKVIMREKIGGFISRVETERFLNEWINQYVTDDKNAYTKRKAKKPLVEGKVEVAEVPGKPGIYKAVAFLKATFPVGCVDDSSPLGCEPPAPTR